MKGRVLIAVLLVQVILVGALPVVAHGTADFGSSGSIEKYLRTELYFGLGRPNGEVVDKSEWQRFVEEFVTPRFPDGVTILEAKGQWRGQTNIIVRESSKVLVIFYRLKDRKAASTKIDEIRNAYKKRFEQESVLRVDLTEALRIYF